jgi:hypothetical protein
MATLPSVAYPLIGGHRYSFASIEANFGGFATIGLTEINYKPSLKGQVLYGTAPQPIGRTRGKAEFPVDFTMYRHEFELLKQGMIGGGVGFGELSIDIIVQYAELGSPVITDSIIAMRIEEPDLSNRDGVDAAMVKCSGNALAILLNGVPIVIPDKVVAF